MIEADRVHSTPPTNTSVSRRHMLAGLAVLPAAIDSQQRINEGLSPLPQGLKADFLEDPAFALIAEKRAADVAHCVAIDAQDEAETRYGNDSEAAGEAWDNCEAACHYVHEVDWRLATTQPTTLAGVAAVLRIANAIEDEGCEWPATDTIGAEGWHYQLRVTMAQAIEAIMRRAV